MHTLTKLPPSPYLSDVYHPQSDLNHLIDNLKNLIDGNQVTRHDLNAHDFHAATFEAKLTIIWEFFGEYHEEVLTGKHDSRIHFGLSQTDFDKHHQNLMGECAYGTRLRQAFLDKIRHQDVAILTDESTRHTFYEHEPFSMRTDCYTCNATGKLTCSDCHGKGKARCGFCGGSGNESYQTPIYDNKGQIRSYQTHYRGCSACFGSGDTRCSPCNGSGLIICKNCTGAGFFTKIHHIKAIAERTYHVNTPVYWHQDILEFTLNSKGTTFCASKIDFHQMYDEETDADIHVFYYKGHSIAFEQPFAIKNKEYICYAFASPPYAYVRPAIFDDLFADEFAFLRQSMDNKGKLNKQKARMFFERYAKQPALDHAMQLIAKQPPHLDKFGQCINQACQGFVSSSFADEFGLHIHRIMSKISPSFSILAWVASFMPFLFFMSTMTIYRMQNIELGVFSLLFTLIGTTFYVATITLIALGVSIVASYIHLFFMTKHIPTAYRQTISHSTPIRFSLKIIVGILVLGCLYGILANLGHVPKLPQGMHDKGMQVITYLKTLIR